MLTELAILVNFKYIEPMQKNAEQKAQTKYLITDKGYTQLINQYTLTDRSCVYQWELITLAYYEHRHARRAGVIFL